MLRKTKDQHIISRLAKINNLHLIASIDHINAPLMWDQTCMDNFNFVWYDCTTLLPYKNETAFENSVFFQNSGELDLAAMSNVFRSLTTNARGIYMILVNNQIANHKDSNYQGRPIRWIRSVHHMMYNWLIYLSFSLTTGMTFKDLYHKCRESFLVSSDSTLRTQLIEFVDHNMAKIKRSHDGTEQVTIPISIQILSLFSQQQNDWIHARQNTHTHTHTHTILLLYHKHYIKLKNKNKLFIYYISFISMSWITQPIIMVSVVNRRIAGCMTSISNTVLLFKAIPSRFASFRCSSNREIWDCGSVQIKI